jgi:hypothetical protein
MGGVPWWVLKDLLNSPRFVFNDLNKDERLKSIKDKIGSHSGKFRFQESTYLDIKSQGKNMWVLLHN